MKENHSIVQEIMTEGYINRARERARRKKNLWNLIMLPFVIIGVLGISIALFTVLWHLNIWIYPQHAGKLREIMRSNDHTASLLLMILPSFFASIPLGMLFANCIAWCIPPVRQTFQHEAKGIALASFRESMSGLGKVALYIAPLYVGLGVVGAFILR